VDHRNRRPGRRPREVRYARARSRRVFVTSTRRRPRRPSRGCRRRSEPRSSRCCKSERRPEGRRFLGNWGQIPRIWVRSSRICIRRRGVAAQTPAPAPTAASSILASPLAKAALAGIAAMVVRRVMQGAAR